MTADTDALRLVPASVAQHAANNMRIAYHKTRLTREVMVSPDDLSVVLDFVAQAAAPAVQPAGEPWGYAARRTGFRGSPTQGEWTAGKIGDGFYMLTVEDPEWEIVTLYAHPPAQGSESGGVLADIAAERRRQVEVEGWSQSHDDEHERGEMAKAAACYAAGQIVSAIPHEIDPDRGAAGYRSIWPWDSKWWKPKTYRRNLVRAAALLVAEIERIDRRIGLQRAALSPQPGPASEGDGE